MTCFLNILERGKINTQINYQSKLKLYNSDRLPNQDNKFGLIFDDLMLIKSFDIWF